jgi:hypothetical protein
MDETSLVFVNINAEFDDTELEPVARELIHELEMLPGIDKVALQKVATPVGAKGETFDWSTLIITVVSTGAFTSLVAALSNWATRDRRRSIKVTIEGNTVELTGISKKEQGDLLAMFKARTRPPLAKGENE